MNDEPLNEEEIDPDKLEALHDDDEEEGSDEPKPISQLSPEETGEDPEEDEEEDDFDEFLPDDIDND